MVRDTLFATLVGGLVLAPLLFVVGAMGALGGMGDLAFSWILYSAGALTAGLLSFRGRRPPAVALGVAIPFLILSAVAVASLVSNIPSLRANPVLWRGFGTSALAMLVLAWLAALLGRFLATRREARGAERGDSGHDVRPL